MSEQELSTEEILSSIRQMLSDDLHQENSKSGTPPSVSEMMDVFVLTSEMRCLESDILKEKMQRVLEKMSQQSSDTVL